MVQMYPQCIMLLIIQMTIRPKNKNNKTTCVSANPTYPNF